MRVIIIVSGIAILCLIIFYMGRQTHLENLLHQYNKIVALTEKDILYRSKQLPLFGGGILFYQVRFSDIPFDHSVDKMSIAVNGTDVKVSLQGVRFNLDDALRSKNDLAQSFKTYIPYTHVFTRPLETLVLCGVNDVYFDAAFSLEKDGLSRHVLGQVYDKQIGRALFDFYIPSEMNKLSPSELSKAVLLDGTFSFEDLSVADDYRAYATSLGIKEPANWLTGVSIK
ncbi:MAG: hypothetical protein IKV03_00515 [Alphaproteobacteria bacterium]|nr:hypothetical protein [Alphaproteobacteria bacterium]